MSALISCSSVTPNTRDIEDLLYMSSTSFPHLKTSPQENTVFMLETLFELCFRFSEARQQTPDAAARRTGMIDI